MSEYHSFPLVGFFKHPSLPLPTLVFRSSKAHPEMNYYVGNLSTAEVSDFSSRSDFKRVFHPILSHPPELHQYVPPLCSYWTASRTHSFSTDLRSSVRRSSDASFYPLATLEDGVTFVAFVEAHQAKLGYVTWKFSYPATDAMVPIHEQISGHEYNRPLFGDFGDHRKNPQILFSPRTNMLYAWSSTRDLVRYDKIMESSTLKSCGFDGLHFADLSIWGAYRFPLDRADVEIKSSRDPEKSWKIHLDLLSSHVSTGILKKQLELIKLLKDDLPVASISAFIDTLYHRPLTFSSKDSYQNALTICHVGAMWESLNRSSKFLAQYLSDALKDMDGSLRLKLFIELWFDPIIEWSISSDVIMALLTLPKLISDSLPSLFDAISPELHQKYPVRAISFGYVLGRAAWRSRESIATSRTYILPLEVKWSKFQQDPSSSSNTPTSSINKVTDHNKNTVRYFKEALEEYEAPQVTASGGLGWLENLLKSNSTDFAFGITDYPDWIVAKGWLLYSDWPWFTRLVDSNLKESRSRIITMPHWVTPNLLLTMIRCLYDRAELGELLNQEEMFLLLSNAKEIGFVNADGSPYFFSERIIFRCKILTLEPIHAGNWVKMLKLSHDLGLVRERNEALDLLDMRRELVTAEALEKLGEELRAMVLKGK